MRISVIILAALLTACSGGGSSGGGDRKPRSSPTGWYFQYGEPDPKMQADGVSSIWTASPRVEPHYWLKGWGKPFQPEQTLTVTYRIEAVEGAPVIKSTECKDGQRTDAKAALMIRSSTDNTQEYNRAWYGVRPYMTMGEHTISAPLNGEGWKFVFDSVADKPGKWSNLLANPRDIALTFNGCSSAGHGAYVEGGSVKITIISVAVR